MNKFKVPFLVFACCLLFGLPSSRLLAETTPVPPEHPISAEQVKRLLEISHAIERMRKSLHETIAKQQVALPYFPTAFWSDFEAEFDKLDWIAISTPVYQKYLSQDDAAKAIAFYSTDAGQRSLDSAMAVSSEMTQQGFEQGKAIGQRLGIKYQAEIAANMRKAQEATAPAAPKQ
jgi:hypothetical protein